MSDKCEETEACGDDTESEPTVSIKEYLKAVEEEELVSGSFVEFGKASILYWFENFWHV